jgi:hypothetical protein
MLTVRSKTIELPAPVLDNGRQVTTIALTPPTIGMKRQAEGYLRNGTTGEAATKFQIAVVARCSGQPEAVIEQLDGDVFNEAWEFAASFLAYVPETTSPRQ